jgi:hypothetical protein
MGFEKPVINEINPFKEKISVDFKKASLPDGIYFYRISYIDQLGFESKFSNPVQFSIDSTPPLLTITSPRDQEEFDTEFVHIEGKTDPTTELKVNGAPADVDGNGNFITALIPDKGRNSVKFVATDRSGNLSEKTIVIYKVAKANKQYVEVAKTDLSDKSRGIVSTTLGALTIFVILGVVFLILR